MAFSGEVHHCVRLVFLKDRLKRRQVTNVCLLKCLERTGGDTCDIL